MATTVYGRNDQASYNWFGSLFFKPTKSAKELTSNAGESIGGFFGSTAAGVLKPIFPMLLIFGVAVVIAYTVAKRIAI